MAVYAMKDVLLPLLNSKIRFYSIPHRFSFELYHGICTMQYSLFSTHRDLLPPRPEEVPGKFVLYLLFLLLTQLFAYHYPCLLAVTDLEIVDSLDVAFNNFSLVGGEEAFVNECGGSANLDRGGLLQNQKIVNVSCTLCSVLPCSSFITDCFNAFNDSGPKSNIEYW